MAQSTPSVPNTAADDPAPAADAAGGLRRRLSVVGQDLGLVAVLILLVVVFSIASPHFLNLSNLTNVLRSVSIIGTMAAIMTLVLVAGALDLSIGSIAALSGVVSAMAIGSGVTPFAGFGLALLVGVASGAVNGFAVVVLRINPIIVTIGTLAMFRGIVYVISNGRDTAVEDPVSESLAFDRWLFLPVPVWVMLAVFALTWLVSSRTVVGRSIYAVGANPRAARLSGVPVSRARFIVLVASGLGAAIAGILLSAQAGAATPSAATGYELQVLTAVLIGGASLTGGAGRVPMTLVGVLIIGVINNGMTLLAVPSYYQQVASGALLVIAVAIDQVRRRTGYR